MSNQVIAQSPDVLGGEPVFAGTRVPVKSLFDHLEAGDSIEDFLDGFPSVRRDQVITLAGLASKTAGRHSAFDGTTATAPPAVETGHLDVRIASMS